MPKVEDGPWPAFPADLTSIALALATQAAGSVIIHEKMFENRLFFTDKLQLMGAAITICDPHRAIVVGPRRLPRRAVESPDIRAGMAMLIAALCADGVTEIGNIRQIDRGYERIDERLRDLGARIERVDDVARRHEREPSRVTERLQRSSRLAMVHRIPSGTRDVLPDEMRELRAMTDRIRGRVRAAPATARSTRRRSNTRRRSSARRSTRRSPAYRMFDEQGNVLVLRSDMTIPIARLVATPLRARRAAAALLLPGARLPRRAPAARTVARAPAGRGRADRLARLRTGPPRRSPCCATRSTRPG